MVVQRENKKKCDEKSYSETWGKGNKRIVWRVIIRENKERRKE